MGGGLALLLWCALRGLLPRRDGWPPELVLKRVIPAALALVGFQICFFRGVQEAGVAVGTVAAIGFSPVVVAVLGFLLLGEKPVKIWYASTALAIAGLILLNWRNGGSGGGGSALVLPLAAGFCYACYYVFSKPLGQRHPPETVMMVLCLAGGVCLSPVFFLYPTAWMLSLPGALVALHLGVITTALAFSLTLAGLRETPAAAAATLGLGEPLGAACLGIFFLHESVGVPALAGMALLLGGAYLLIRGVITWQTPVCFVGTVFVLSLILGQDAVRQILSGGLLLGAFFMATDYVTTPQTCWGRALFGIGAGLLTCLIRFYGSYAEGVSFAILFMNILTPYLSKWTRSKPLGGVPA